MVRTVEAAVMRAPHGHCIREQNPAARDATLSAACLPESGMPPCRAGTARHAGEARTARHAPGEARSLQAWRLGAWLAMALTSWHKTRVVSPEICGTLTPGNARVALPLFGG